MSHVTEGKALIIQKWIRGTLARKKLLAINNKFKQLQRGKIKLLKNTVNYSYHSYELSHNYYEGKSIVVDNQNKKDIKEPLVTKEKTDNNKLVKNQVKSIDENNEFSLLYKPNIEFFFISSELKNSFNGNKSLSEVADFTSQAQKIKPKSKKSSENSTPLQTGYKKTRNDIDKTSPEKKKAISFHKKNVKSIKFISSNVYTAETKALCMIYIGNKSPSPHIELINSNIFPNKSLQDIKNKQDDNEKIKKVQKVKADWAENGERIIKIFTKHKITEKAFKKERKFEDSLLAKSERKSSHTAQGSNIINNNSGNYNKHSAKTDSKCSPYDIKYSQKQLREFYNVMLCIDNNHIFPKLKLIKPKKKQEKPLAKDYINIH